MRWADRRAPFFTVMAGRGFGLSPLRGADHCREPCSPNSNKSQATVPGARTIPATVVQTSRGSLLRSWGDVDPSDTVWMHHFVTATDAALVVGAMDRWANSAEGETMAGQMHLSGVVAGGVGSPATSSPLATRARPRWKLGAIL